VSEAPGHGESGRHWAALALGMAAWVLREAAGRRAFPAARITGIREVEDVTHAGVRCLRGCAR
jgi:hypothetical protein